MHFAGVWAASQANWLFRESGTETHDGTRSYYFNVPGQFFIFNSSPDQAITVMIEEYR